MWQFRIREILHKPTSATEPHELWRVPKDRWDFSICSLGRIPGIVVTQLSRPRQLSGFGRMSCCSLTELWGSLEDPPNLKPVRSPVQGSYSICLPFQREKKNGQVSDIKVSWVIEGKLSQIRKHQKNQTIILSVVLYQFCQPVLVSK